MEITKESIKAAEKVLIDNGIESDEAATVLQAIGYTLLDASLYDETGNTLEDNFHAITVWNTDDLQDAYDNAMDAQLDDLPDDVKRRWWKENGKGFCENLIAYGNEMLSEIDWDTLREGE